MLRNVLLCGLLVSVMTLVGCAKREGDPPRAETAVAGLMPSVDEGFEPTYIADQKQITMAGDVNVSLEPLETFREAKAEADSRAESSSDDEDGATSAPATTQGDDEWEEEDDDAWEDGDKAKDAAPAETKEKSSEETEEEAED